MTTDNLTRGKKRRNDIKYIWSQNLQETRAGQWSISVGVRSQIPEPTGPMIWDLRSAAVHLQASVTAVMVVWFGRSSGWFVSGLKETKNRKKNQIW